MAENENVIQTEIQPETQPEKKKKKSNGGFKEWWRKFLVNLKRKPQRIPMVILFIACAVYLIALTSFSKSLYNNYNTIQERSALCVFVCTLFSMLVVVSFMRVFPKYKKPSIVMLIVTLAFIALLIVMDVLVITEISSMRYDNFTAKGISAPDSGADSTSIAVSIVHIVLEAIAAILLVTLPLWRKLLMKINTRKEVESASSSMDTIDLNGEE